MPKSSSPPATRKDIDEVIAVVNAHAQTSSSKFIAMDQRFDKQDRKFDNIYQILDKLAGKIDNNHQELVALKVQVNRHEQWHHQTAKKIGLKLKY
ncbi:MAG: hypothetical protein R3313_00370 [Candidatus Saccharimonadales bacterium]|nr:hypothetical protein [Candidatus Saccharimonadales bacterium]